MKSLVAAISTLAAVALAAPAFAQAPAVPQVSGYVDLGYAFADTNLANFGVSPGYHVLQGRLGAKLGRFVGAEGELGVGINTASNLTSVSGTTIEYRTRLKDSYAGYLVGYLPVAPRANLFARVGYGHSDLKYEVPGLVSGDTGANSWNFGGGVQYFLTAHDGVRAEYTRHDLRQGAGNANVWGVSYVRRFH